MQSARPPAAKVAQAVPAVRLASWSVHLQRTSSQRTHAERPDDRGPRRNSVPPRDFTRRNNDRVQRVDSLEHDRDFELCEVLDLATDQELEQIYEALYSSSLLSPIGKSLQTAEPPALHYRGRDGLIRRIEHRFRFLAADAMDTLRGTWPTYRQTLLGVRQRLEVPCPATLATCDLESEVFLHLLNEHADAVGAAVPGDAAGGAAEHASHGDGMAPPSSGPTGTARKPNIVQRALAPLKLGASEVLPALSKLGASLAVTNLQTNVVRTLGTSLMRRSIQYEAAMQLAVTVGSKGLAGTFQSPVAVSAAQRGLTAAASRYAAARSVLAFLGPLMWASTFLDLARMSIGTDVARVVKVVFMLAQIRCLRTSGWTQEPDEL